jgi:hypothetical protein
MGSNTSLDSSGGFTHGCGASFENRLCLIPLINGQWEEEMFSGNASCAILRLSCFICQKTVLNVMF